MSKKGNFKKNQKISKVKKNTYSNSVSLTKEAPKDKEENVIATVNEEQTPENIQAKYIMIISFACLGFIFTFLANYGFFDLTKAFLAGFWGFAGGAAFAYLPYWLASREN